MSKHSAKFYFLVTSLFLTASCGMFKPYRATIGLTSNNTEYKKVSKNSNGDEKKEQICVKHVHDSIDNPQKCGDGYKADNGVAYLDPWLEFMPTYFGKSDFGFSYFFSYNRSKTTLLDYPTVSEESEVTISRLSINPIIFYNFGDQYIKGGKGMSFRIGLGMSGNYVTQFKIKRSSTGEIYEDDQPLRTGTSAFVEASYDWLIFRVENSMIQYDNKKFADVPNDTIEISAIKVSLYYSYYFK